MKNSYTHINNSLLSAILTQTASDSEHAEFDQWLKQSEANQEYYKKLCHVWQKSSSLEDFSNISLTNDWQLIRNRISFRDNRKRKLLIYYAAASLVFCLTVGRYLYKNIPGFGYIQKSEIQANVSNIILNDQSSVYLNIGSQLIYPKNFNSERKVTLKGEAYFDVKTDSVHPFIIATQNGTIKVMGTSFNVFQNENTTRVTVNSGKVIFQNSNNEAVVLTKGEVGISSENSISESTNSDINFDSWKTNIIQFKENTLQEICNTISAHFRIELVNNVKSNIRLTSVFKNQNLKQILTELEIQFDIIIQKQGSKYTLVSKI